MVLMLITQQESSMTSGSSSPPASNTSPVQALNFTDAWPAGRFSSDCQTEKFRQWTMTCCTASELSRCRKFNWTRPTLISGCSNRYDRHSQLCAIQCVHITNGVLPLQTSGVFIVDLHYLGSRYWFQASLSTSCEVAGDLNCVWGAAEVRVDPVSAYKYKHWGLLICAHSW